MNEVAAQTTTLKKIFAPRSFAKNFAYLFGSQVFSQALGMIALIRVARILAPAGYGYYNLVQTSASIGMVIAGLGMRNVIIRDCARNPEKIKSQYFTGLFVRLLFSSIVGMGIIFYALLSPHVLPISLSGFTIMLLLGLIIWDTTESISFGMQRMEFSSRTNTLGSALWLLWVWCVPASVLTVAIVSFSFALLQIIKAVLLGWQVKRIIPPAYALERSSLRKDGLSLITASLPFYWMMLLETVQGGLPVLILAQRSIPEQVGLFNIGFRLLRPLQLLFLTNITVLYPYLSKAKQKNPAQYMRAMERALKITLVIGGACAFLVSLLRKEVVYLLFGEKYAGSADAVAYQCWYTVLWAIVMLIGTSLLASDRQHLWAVLTTIFTIFTLPIIWFGAGHGATVLAAWKAVGVAITLIFIWPFFKKSLPSGFLSRDVMYSSIVLSIAILCSWLTPSNISIAIKILITGIILSILAVVLLKEWKQAIS